MSEDYLGLNSNKATPETIADSLDNLRGHNDLKFGPFSLSVAERQLRKGDHSIPLGSRALDVLIKLTERPGEVVTNKELVARVWPDVVVEEANLRVQIAALRKALGDGIDNARYISNVPGRGYCFVATIAQGVTREALPPHLATNVTNQMQKLPPLLTRMVGRDETVRALLSQMTARRFVSIVGPGGVGKTTVAVAVGHALLDAFQGAVVFVDLGALTDPRLVATAVASSLGVTTSSQDPMLGLLGFLRDRRTLLILDSCEHLIDAAAQLGERVVNETPQAHILATSREALRAEGEHVHLLYPLDTPPYRPGLSADEALQYPAVQLFMDRAFAAGHYSELSDTDALDVASICRRLDGIALAIELAASRVGNLGINGTAELLDNRFGGVWNGRRTALPRHQTLNSMLDWSYNLLSDLERLVLCRLSIFVGEFTITAARDVATEAEFEDAHVMQAVTDLVAKSLISTKSGQKSTNYRLLDTTRAYALAKLADRGEADRIARRHAETFCRYLNDDRNLQSGNVDEVLVKYAWQIGNVRAALDWALSARGDRAIGVELAACAAPLLIGMSLLDECANYCQCALAMIDVTSGDARLEMILQQALALSSMFTKGNGNEVRAAIDRGLQLAENLNDRPHQLTLLAGLNVFLTRIADFSGSIEVAQRALRVAQADKNAAGIVMSEWMLGVSQHLAGNQAAAQRHCEDGMIHAAELGALNPNWFGYDHRVRALVALARALWLRGLSDQASRAAQQAIDEAAYRDQPTSVCISFIYGAPVFRWIGDLDRAEHSFDQLIKCAERYSLAPYRALGIALKGEVMVARGEADKGLRLVREALAALYSEQHKILLTVFTAALAEGLRKTGQLEEALLTLNGAISRATSCGATFDLADLLRLKAEVLMEMPQGDREAALNSLKESMELAREQSALAYELRSAIVLARLLSKSGQRDEARDILGQVYGRFTEGHETSDLKLASSLLRTLQ
ncbi:winged helix-turn-helix domain-containing protein [Bradyrhizobium sp. CB1650]|uniref:ATP-binding protein n=1 Tax=Bradyrhizobium sp. CB1650 TaxID=3039153 RepID=UPI00243490B8|nr:winged helix-turn-helix domain-containing protein [Bradyrhizobium sp. CB1650]WGD50310.1 winged helix-turn-helix domain-containing protein [Bradyrhizobium sp. CB1650]